MKERNIAENEVEVGRASFRRQRWRERIRKRLMQEKDIKYVGPLSYRYLRIIAWISIFLGQLAFISMLVAKIIGFNFLTDNGYTIVSIFGALAAPLFIIASFGLVLNNKRSIVSLLMSYGVAFIGVGGGICFFYIRYIRGLLLEVGMPVDIANIFTPYLGKVVDVNVFADLFSFLLFHFFINYTPRPLRGKNITWFRCLCIIPVAFVITSYVFRIMNYYNAIDLPFYVYPFLTTKSPLVFMIFVMASIWIKNRERLYLKLGATREDYQKFLTTNRNSFAFSLQLVILIAVFSFIEGAIALGGFVFSLFSEISFDEVSSFYAAIGIGQCASLLVTTPFVLLYSYTRVHKNPIIDPFIPVGGIALIAILYLESVYQLIVNFVNA